MRHIIINVDDLGLSNAVNEAVVNLAEKKRISATSYMSGGSIETEHQQALQSLGIDIGLHLDFTGIFPSPLTASLKSILLKSYMKQLNVELVRDNIREQFDRFIDCFGHLPAFVDGHQHVHQFPIIRELLMLEIKHRESSSFRSIASRSTQPLVHDFKSWVIYALGGWHWTKICQKNDVATNHGFAGVYGFDKSEAELAQLWEKWLLHCPKNKPLPSLIMCHPAVKKTGWYDDIKVARETEYQWMMSEGFNELSEQYDLKLSGWQDTTNSIGSVSI